MFRFNAIQIDGFERFVGSKTTHQFVTFFPAPTDRCKLKDKPVRIPADSFNTWSWCSTECCLKYGVENCAAGVRFVEAAKDSPGVIGVSFADHGDLSNKRGVETCSKVHKNFMLIPESFASEVAVVYGFPSPPGPGIRPGATTGGKAVHWVLKTQNCTAVRIYGAVSDGCYPYHYNDEFSEADAAKCRAKQSTKVDENNTHFQKHPEHAFSQEHAKYAEWQREGKLELVL